MRQQLRALWFTMLFLPVASAQFQFSVVAGGTEEPLATVYDFGKVASGEYSSTHFRLRNTSTAAAKLNVLEVAGIGFTLSGGPSLPVTIMPQAAVDFVVTFTATLPASYSAALEADGITAQLAARVVAGLSYQVETAVGKISLQAAVDFGSATLGHSETLRFDISNQTASPLPIPAIAIGGGDFALVGPVPAGILQPGQTSGFQVQFQPTVAGLRNATLTIGARTIGLTGTGIVPILPTPQINVALTQPQSAQQGSLTVTFDSPATEDGSGEVAIGFQPSVDGPTDPTIAFAGGSLIARFEFHAGDTQASFGGQPTIAFQTGTTAGKLVFTAQIGAVPQGQSVQQTVTIAPALVGLTTVAATRSKAAVTVQLSGFDNTRTAGALTFSFFDAGGNILAGPISADGGPAFQTYFHTSPTGGGFGLEAVFPVGGDPARIKSFTASVTNLAGTTTTAQTPF